MSNTKKTLSEDAKNARMELWATRLGLDKSIVEKLNKQYGPYAYELMRQAQYPGNFNKKTGYPYTSAAKMVQNFLDPKTAPSAEQIAKAVGSDAATVKKTLASLNKINGNPEVHEQQTNQSQRTGGAFSLTDKQKREMRAWCNNANVKLPADATMTKLVEKYGTLAYDIMKKSMHEPSKIMQDIGQKPLGSSKKTIEYFLNHTNEISIAQLAAATGKTEAEVKQALPSGREQQLSERIDKHQQRTQQQQVQSQAKPKAVEKPQTGVGAHTSDYKKFRKWCYGQMEKGEGRYNCVTLDMYGHPTTGVGTLICPADVIKKEWNAYKKQNPNATYKQFANSIADTCKDPKKAQKIKSGTVAAWRQQWVKDGGDPAIFDNCVVGVSSGNLVPNGKDVEKIPGAGWKVKASANSKYGNISNEMMEKMFNKRFDQCYDTAKGKIKNFDAQTDYARLSAVHGVYMGLNKVIKNNSTINQALVSLSDSAFVKSEGVRTRLEYALREYNIPRQGKIAQYKKPNFGRTEVARA